MSVKHDHPLIVIGMRLADGGLGLRSFSLQEQLSYHFQIESELSGEKCEVDLDKVVDDNSPSTPKEPATIEQLIRECGLGGRLVRQVLNSANAGRQSVMMGRFSGEVRQALSAQSTHQLAGALRYVFGGAGGIAASAPPAQWTGSASGSVNALGNLVVHVVNSN
jgi:hypothetical protein